jgi:hypothetical protein
MIPMSQGIQHVHVWTAQRDELKDVPDLIDWACDIHEGRKIDEVITISIPVGRFDPPGKGESYNAWRAGVSEKISSRINLNHIDTCGDYPLGSFIADWSCWKKYRDKENLDNPSIKFSNALPNNPTGFEYLDEDWGEKQDSKNLRYEALRHGGTLSEILGVSEA